MHGFSTDAVALKEDDVFDADRLLLLFTRERGKLRARARGVRRPGSRLSGHLLTYLPARLQLEEGRTGIDLITQAQVGALDRYPDEPLRFFGCAQAIGEALDRVLQEREAQPEAYDGFVYTLARLIALTQGGVEAERLSLVTCEYLLKLLIVLGYEPVLDRCVMTGAPLDPALLFWSSEAGGALSPEGRRICTAPSQAVPASRALLVLRQLARPEFMAERLAMDEEVRAEACALVLDYVQTRLGVPLRSLRFVR